MAPEPCGCGGFKVTSFVEPCAKEVVGKFARLWQAVGATYDFKIAPSVVLKCRQIIFLTELSRNVSVFDTNVFWPCHWRLQVKVGCIEACKFCSGSRQNAIDHQFDECEVCRRCAYIVFYCDVTTCDSDPGSIGILFVWADFTNNSDKGNVFASQMRYISKFDGTECVRAGDSLSFGTFVPTANTLAETSHLIGVGCLPNVFQPGMLAQSTILHCFACFFVCDGACKCFQKLAREPSHCGVGRSDRALLLEVNGHNGSLLRLAWLLACHLRSGRKACNGCCCSSGRRYQAKDF